MPAALKKRISKKSLIFYKVMPFIVVIIGANVFLMGFLLSGVLSDYKKSEKMRKLNASNRHASFKSLTARPGSTGTSPFGTRSSRRKGACRRSRPYT